MLVTKLVGRRKKERSKKIYNKGIKIKINKDEI